MWFIMVYVTYENMKEAQKVVNHLLDHHIIACANFFDIKSTYRRNWSIQDSNEVVSVLKTKSENREILEEEIKIIHTYKTPCIIKIDVVANIEYENWIKTETSITKKI